MRNKRMSVYLSSALCALSLTACSMSAVDHTAQSSPVSVTPEPTQTTTAAVLTSSTAATVSTSATVPTTTAASTTTAAPVTSAAATTTTSHIPVTAAPIPEETLNDTTFSVYAVKENAPSYSDATCKKVLKKYNIGAKVKVSETFKEKKLYKLDDGSYVKMSDFEKKGDDKILAVAMSQLGNIGGEPYWTWYGFNERIEWCAVFISWCAAQCGYTEQGIIPVFAGCPSGAAWFQERDEWQWRDYEPVAGQIIFLDWNGDGSADHVGFVERVDENGYVWTVEGNADDLCKQRHYHLSNEWILGYATPSYP